MPGSLECAFAGLVLLWRWVLWMVNGMVVWSGMVGMLRDKWW
jgi:hypothetical protein